MNQQIANMYCMAIAHPNEDLTMCSHEVEKLIGWILICLASNVLLEQS